MAFLNKNVLLSSCKYEYFCSQRQFNFAVTTLEISFFQIFGYNFSLKKRVIVFGLGFWVFSLVWLLFFSWKHVVCVLSVLLYVLKLITFSAYVLIPVFLKDTVVFWGRGGGEQLLIEFSANTWIIVEIDCISFYSAGLISLYQFLCS